MAGRAIRFLRAADGVRPSALVAAAAKQDGGNGDAERRNARKATHWACSVRSPLVGINVVVASGSVRRRNGASAQPSPIPPYLPDNCVKNCSADKDIPCFCWRQWRRRKVAIEAVCSASMRHEPPCPLAPLRRFSTPPLQDLPGERFHAD